ncbi:hypothetical protein ACGFK1_21305 [Mycobacterium sp. NPDC048908]|uniref:hypothetical protein n=1 Tax=Mycobacterium sp. NPDC048908 TaxID=3364292 RepID=UPI003719B7F8
MFRLSGVGEDQQHRALASLLVLAALTAVVIGFLVYRYLTRGDSTTKDRGIGAFAGEA